MSDKSIILHSESIFILDNISAEGVLNFLPLHQFEAPFTNPTCIQVALLLQVLFEVGQYRKDVLLLVRRSPLLMAFHQFLHLLFYHCKFQR